jgi:glycosyltransferase involved in cell wall biosynthesis
MIEISILIPTKNGAEDFEACLAAIYSQKYTGLFEVIVIDSGSTDTTVEIARRYPVRIEQISPDTFHHARTRNYVAGLAKGEVLAFLSQDAIPASDTWLAALLTNFQDPAVGAVYGRQFPKAESGIERRSAFAVMYGGARIVKMPMDGVGLGHKYYHFSNANSAIRKSVWEATRFPDDLKVFEDVGIAKRILDSGWRIVYEPEAGVYHSHDFPLDVLFKRYFDIGVVYERLGIWNDRSRASLWRDGWGTFKGKLSLLLKEERPDGTGSSLVKDVGKYVAIQLGRHERLLPRALKKKLSLYNLFD